MSAQSSLLERYQQTLVPGLLLVLAGGLLAAQANLPFGFWGIWLAVVAVTLIAVVCWSSQRSLWRYWVWLLAFLAGGTYYHLAQFHVPPSDISHWGAHPHAQLTGTLLAHQPDKHAYHLAVEAIDQIPVTGTVLLKASRNFPAEALSPSPLSVGQRVTVLGNLVSPATGAFPGDFDYRAYLLQQRITGQFFFRRVLAVETPSRLPWDLSLRHWAEQWRRQMGETFSRHLSPENSAILTSVVLGSQASAVDPEIKQDFAQSGLIHVLAASGMNVGLIAVFWVCLGRWMRLPSRVTWGVAMAGVALYCLMTGLPPSVQRAGLMLEIAFLLKCFRRELHPLTLLCLSGVILMLLNPETVSMIGFQLSFVSTFGILAMVPPLQDRLGFYLTRWGAGILVTPVVAQFWVSPILLAWFQQIPMLSLPANILALPIVALLTYGGFVLGGLSLAMPQWSAALTPLLSPGCVLLRGIAHGFSHLPGAVVTTPALPISSILLGVGLLMVLAVGLHQRIPGSWRTRVAVLAAVLLAALIPPSVDQWQREHTPRVSWIKPDPQHTIEIVQAPHHVAWVNTDRVSMRDARLIPRFLRREGHSHLAILNLTHPTPETLAGLETLVRTVPIDTLTVPGPLAPALQARLTRLSQTMGVPIIAWASTHQVQGPSWQATVFNASPWGQVIRYRFPQGRCYVRSRQTVLGNSLLPPATMDCALRYIQQPQAASTLDTLMVAATARTLLPQTFHQARLTPRGIRIQEE